MSDTIPISPKILKAIALSYTSFYRSLMEYIDNSIDEADRCFFDREYNLYKKEILITVTHTGSTASNSSISVQDNSGTLESSLIKSMGYYFNIGDSKKVNDDLLNGKFGFGMMSFLSICNKLTVTSKVGGEKYISSVIFNAKDLEKTGQNSVPYTGNLEDYNLSVNDNFTRITLNEFFPNKFKEFDLLKLQSEIELHFDLILRRGNLTIKLINNKEKEFICKPFDYNSFASANFERSLNSINIMHYKKGKQEKTIPLNGRVLKVFLQVTPNKVIDRPPYFAINGRRIDKITKFEELRTNNKGSIWGHPNLTGYIDVTGIVEPAITRDRFEESDNVKPLFYTLLKLEDYVKEYIDSELHIDSSRSFNELEKKLTEAFNKFVEKNKKKALSSKKQADETKFEKRSFLLYSANGIVNSSANKKRSNKLVNKVEKGMNKRNNYNRLSEVEIDIPFSDKKQNDERGTEKFNNFSIRIDSQNDPSIDEYGKAVRSIFTGNEILIYKRHPQFEKRINVEYGVEIITSKVISFLANEVITHYSALELNVYSERSDSSYYSDFVSLVYDFESSIKVLEGKKLTELS